jgi:hypothetical protein
VAEWQTRWLQVPVSFGTWGFKSPFAHRCENVTGVLLSSDQLSTAIGTAGYARIASLRSPSNLLAGGALLLVVLRLGVEHREEE